MTKITVDSKWLLQKAEEENIKIKNVGMIAKIKAFFNDKDALRREKEMERSMGRIEMINEIFEKHNQTALNEILRKKS